MLVLGILILATLVYAAPDATVSLVPVSLYESNQRVFNLTVNNLFGNEVIEEVKIQMPSFTITDVVDFFGWQNNFSADEATWYDGDIETNAIELFQLTAQAGLVDANTTIDIDVITTGESSEQTTDTLQIIILNDDTPPSLSNNIPQDNGFLLAEINNQLVSIDAADNETGIKNASFSYYDCTPNASNVTINSVELTGAETYTNNIDLSEYEEGELMCFEFIVYNNAEDSSIINGTTGFDGTPPSVYLIAPDNGSYGNNNTLFQFNATDNLAPTLTCDLMIEGEVIDSATVNNGEISSTTYDMSNVTEGDHDWNIRCTDWVGLYADSETRTIIIDKTAPVITLNSPANGSMIGDGVIIDIDVTDNYEVDTVLYSISLNSSELPEGTNILTVTATDKAGNQAIAEYTFIVDRTAPTINMTSPGNDSDVHVYFVFDTDDNLDNTLDCTIYVDDVPQTTQEVNINETANITLILPVNIYEWYITCLDDAENSVTTATGTLNVTDLTGPDIISDIVYVARTEDYAFDANVTDISGVNSVNIVFNGTSLNITDDGDLYSGVIHTDLSYTLGTYSLTITADDVLGNGNVLVDDFELIQGYIITLSLDPSSVEQGEEVIVSGTVTLDDGGAVPENYTRLYLPDETIDVNIIDGTFEYTYTAGDTGTYTVRAVVTSSEGYEHGQTAELIITSPGGGASSESSSSSSGGGDIYCGDGVCTSAVNEDCNSCSADCGECPEEEPEEAESGEEVEGTNLTEEIHPEEPREPSPGVGAASGWFSRVTSNPWVWVVFLLIMGSLYVMSSGKKEKINWNGYFNK